MLMHEVQQIMFMAFELNNEDKKAINKIFALVEDIQNNFKMKVADKIKNKPGFQSMHNLHYEEMPGTWYGEKKYRVGTCTGIYHFTRISLNIVAIVNSEPGNGHFEDVLQWFERSCRRDKKNLVFMHCDNLRFRDHLITNRGFKMIPGTTNVCKIIN